MPISRELQYSKCDKTKLLYKTSSVLEGTRRLRRRSAAILANDQAKRIVFPYLDLARIGVQSGFCQRHTG